MGKIKDIIITLFSFTIRGYQYCISPLLGNACRFYPTCSNYSLNAFEKFGFAKGLFLTCKRLTRCHPWCKGGIDFLPEK